MTFVELSLLWGLIAFPIAMLYYALFETPEARAKRWRKEKPLLVDTVGGRVLGLLATLFFYGFAAFMFYAMMTNDPNWEEPLPPCEAEAPECE